MVRNAANEEVSGVMNQNELLRQMHPMNQIALRMSHHLIYFTATYSNKLILYIRLSIEHNGDPQRLMLSHSERDLIHRVHLSK